MRLFTFPLVLAGLLGSAALAPAAVLAYPYSGQRYAYDSFAPQPRRSYAPEPVSPYGYGGSYPNPYGNQRYAYDSYAPQPRRSYAPEPVSPYGYGGGYSNPYGDPIAADPTPYTPPPVRHCNRGTVLTGAAIGGGLGAIMASNSRTRLWSLPMGAAMGGILGGVLSGC